MRRAIKHAIYAYIHHKGWCEKMHSFRSDSAHEQTGAVSWLHCPFVEKIVYDLNPPMLTNGCD